MSISRRKFLRSSTLVALSAAIPLQSVLGQKQTINQARTAADPLANYTRTSFTSYVNSIFRLYTERSTVDLTLLKVKELPAAMKGGECFTLLFVGGDKALPQETYKIEHAAMGTFQLFLVPGGADENGAQMYLATINRVPYSPAAVPTRILRSSVPSAKPE